MNRYLPLLVSFAAGCFPYSTDCDKLEVEDCTCGRTASCLSCFSEQELSDADALAECDPTETTDPAVDTGDSCPVAPNCDDSFWTGHMNNVNTHYATIEKLCFQGSSDVGAPDMEVLVPNSPSLSGPYLAFDTDKVWDGCEFDVTVAHGTPGHPLVQDACRGVFDQEGVDCDGSTWSWETVPASPCDYGVETISAYVVWPDGTQGWTIGGSCPASVAPMAAVPAGKVPSGSQTCTPGSETFELQLLRRAQGALDDSLVRWVPIATGPNPEVPPERAWLTQLEVLDWGTADNLQISSGPHFAAFLHNGATPVQTSAMTSAGPAIRTFAASSQPFVSTLGSEHVDVSASDFEGPTVKLTWTCGVQTPSHFAPPVGLQGHVGTLPSAAGVGHRVVVWVDTTNLQIRFAPEGRFADNVLAALTPATTGHTFEASLPAFDATLTGRLVQTGSTYKLEALTLAQGDASASVPDIQLSAL